MPSYARLGVGLLLALTAGVAVLIAAGAFDPALPRTSVPLPLQTVDLSPSAAPHVTWLLDPPADQGVTAARLTAQLETGEIDIGYGLLLGTLNDHWALAVSPTGYVSVWRTGGGRPETVMPWQPWVHVRQGGEANELWLALEKGDFVARVNREVVWRQSAEKLCTSEPCSVAVWATTFGDAATIRLLDLAVSD